jgi:hypothetical protein
LIPVEDDAGSWALLGCALSWGEELARPLGEEKKKADWARFEEEKENNSGPVLSLENTFLFQIFYKMQIHLNANSFEYKSHLNFKWLLLAK